MLSFGRDPLEREFRRLWRQMDELFEELTGPKPRRRLLKRELWLLKERLVQAARRLKERLGWNGERELLIPVADVEEEGDRYRVCLELPGVRKGDLKVTVCGRELVVEGRGKSVRNGRAALVQEIEYGDYYRVFELPEDVDTERIQARLENGLLTINIPRTGQAQVVEIVS